MYLPQNFSDKSGFPYLVDVKITEFCPFVGGTGICKNCYQSSTKNGAHADQYFLSAVLPSVLMDAGVLEVNFGGGEPTLYKGIGYGTLEYVLISFKSKKFKVGITTKNYKWYNSDNFGKCLNNIDSVAISVNSIDEFKEAQKLKNKILEINSDISIYYQCVFGLLDYSQFKELILAIAESNYGDNITLLGYKDFGMGKGGDKFDYPDEWVQFISDINKKHEINIGIDSVMVKNWKEKLLNFGIRDYFLVGTEGKSTCYVDAVKQRMFSSSFSYDDGLPMPNGVGDKKVNFLENFSKF